MCNKVMSISTKEKPSVSNSKRSGIANHEPLDLKVCGQSIKTTPVFDAYWRFANARQKVFFDRHFPRNIPFAPDADPILRKYKFTNSYRSSDRVSQYLIRNVIKPDIDFKSQFIRILLFKIFNRIETWEAILTELGDVSHDTFNVNQLDAILAKRQSDGIRNYSAAYIMPSAGRRFDCVKKHTSHLRLIQWMIDNNYPERLQDCRALGESYSLLIEAPSIGPFLAYQFATDLNYSTLTTFSEMEFVKAGPGALDGVSKCFTGIDTLHAEDLIRYMADTQDEHFERLGIKFQSLWGRPLQLIDCQNLFCEISKYSRVAYPHIPGIAGRTRIKQNYSPSSRATELPVYPKSWGLDTSSPPQEYLNQLVSTSKCEVMANENSSLIEPQGSLF